jgi:hypothetical protein
MNGRPFHVNVTDAALRQEWAEVNNTLAGVRELQAQMLEKLDEIARLQRRKDPIRLGVVLGGGGTPPIGIPYKLVTQGYRHSRLWLAGAQTLTVDLGMGTGSASLSCVAGWNVLDAGDGALLATTTNTVVNAVIELTDDPVQ